MFSASSKSIFPSIRLGIVAAFFTALGVVSASSVALGASATQGAPPRQAAPPSLNQDGFVLRSEAFENSTRIPDRFTIEGKDLSPPLEWSNAPAETKSFAIICEDIDLGRRPFAHWVIYGIGADVTELPEGLARERELTEPIAAKQGSSSFPKDNVGYRGPATPRGNKPHRYRFTIYALSAIPEVKPGLNAETLRARMKDIILAEASLVGTFSRARRPGETPPGEQAPELPPGSKPGDPAPTPPSDPSKPGRPAQPPRPAKPAGPPANPPSDAPPSPPPAGDSPK